MTLPVVNALVDRHRVQARAPERVAMKDGGPYPTPAMQALGIALDEALGRLPQEDREAFLLREVGGLRPPRDPRPPTTSSR